MIVPVVSPSGVAQSHIDQGASKLGSVIVGNDLQLLNTTPLGYSNGNLAYLDSFGQPSVDPQICCDEIRITSLSASPVFGEPLPHSWKVHLTAWTVDLYPATIDWSWGDGNTSTTSAANYTFGPPYYYAELFYNHTYTYAGAFVVDLQVWDGDGDEASDSTPVYSSFVPSLFYSFYNESGLISKGENSTKYSIGLVEECVPGYTTAKTRSDVSTFDSHFGLPAVKLNFFFEDGNSSGCNPVSAWPAGEMALDIEWAHVAAPGAHIFVCEADQPTDAGLQSCDSAFYSNRANGTNVTLVSNSYSLPCAIGNGSPNQVCVNGLDHYGTNWSNFESAGMTYLTSTGDTVPYQGCVDLWYPAANPYDLAVGGTTVVSVGSSGGYGSEAAWSTTTQQNASECTWVRHNFPVYYIADWGETYGTNQYYLATSGQNRLLNNTDRYEPDVSLDGNLGTGVPIFVNGAWSITAGTSLSSPAWAGILYMLFSAGAPGLSGFAVPFLYSHSGCFHYIASPVGGRDGLGTPNVGCLAAA